MIRIGPAGIGAKGIYLDEIAKAGLGAAEVEFTYGVKMSDDTAKEIGIRAKKLGIMLSVHAPYYINLASKDRQKIEASKKRIIESCKKAELLGAKYVVFHPGFYMGDDKEAVFQRIKKNILAILEEMKHKKYHTMLAPETTGKKSQFGSLSELLRLRKETKTAICVDFAHLKARNLGKIDYDEVFKSLSGIRHIHSHFSGIEWTDKGEKRHLPTPEKEIVVLEKAILKYNADITIINESPDQFNDAIKMARILSKLKKSKKTT